MKRPLFILIFTLIHFVLSTATFLLSFSSGMAHFDVGGPEPFFASSTRLIFDILSWPLTYPLLHWAPERIQNLFPGILGYVPICINSFIWATISWVLYLAWHSKSSSP